MQISYYKISDSSIVPIQNEVPPNEWKEKVSWVDIRIDNRNDAADFFEKNDLIKDGRDYIKHPDMHSQPATLEDIKIFNIVISNHDNIYQSDYITIILADKVLITISPESSNLLLNYQNIELEASVEHTSFLYSFFYRLIADILAQGRVNSIIARNRVHHSENDLDATPDKIQPKEIMKVKRDVSQLADIIEDQYVVFGILSSLSVNQDYLDNIDKVKELINGFVPLNVTMTRLEEKAENMHVQYMLIQQEKSARKINVLTIIQAVFVPLTFIAGVYGMNFINMPELKSDYGYFLTWGIFVIIAGALLSYFYKNGWFD